MSSVKSPRMSTLKHPKSVIETGTHGERKSFFKFLNLKSKPKKNTLDKLQSENDHGTPRPHNSSSTIEGMIPNMDSLATYKKDENISYSPTKSLGPSSPQSIRTQSTREGSLSPPNSSPSLRSNGATFLPSCESTTVCTPVSFSSNLPLRSPAVYSNKSSPRQLSPRAREAAQCTVMSPSGPHTSATTVMIPMHIHTSKFEDNGKTMLSETTNKDGAYAARSVQPMKWHPATSRSPQQGVIIEKSKPSNGENTHTNTQNHNNTHTQTHIHSPTHIHNKTDEPIHKAKNAVTKIEGKSGSTSLRTIRFTWKIARALLSLKLQKAENFQINKLPFYKWDLKKVPTLGASPTSCRVQEMFKSTIPAEGSNKRVKVFVKRIPINVWNKQYENANKWNGEYVTDGENFVIEAAALTFLEEYAPGIAPQLLGIIEYNANCPLFRRSSSRKFNQKDAVKPESTPKASGLNGVTHIVIISELYGVDLIDFFDVREREKRPLSQEEKRHLQYDALSILHRLHSYGLCHLDFTGENVLIGSQGLRLCDFAKATPTYSLSLRHIPQEGAKMCPFESCEPTVGKGAYMPPECWKVYWTLEETEVQYPLDDLVDIKSVEERAPYYFKVLPADVYMAGVLLFWIWADGGVWKCSDPTQDERYRMLATNSMNFDMFRECRNWPAYMKNMLKDALSPDSTKRLSLQGLMAHPWFTNINSI